MAGHQLVEAVQHRAVGAEADGLLGEDRAGAVNVDGADAALEGGEPTRPLVSEID